MVFLSADLAIARQRGVDRDAGVLGGEGAARRAYDERYMAACSIYLDEETPAERADLVIEHDDPAHPRIKN
ncbi:hypothetical protein GCM10022234_11790 [Aeromicrobium panaciterrae]|uniref:hypothetical protein n=1 Tax=Aeromicrobium panaciterrae TaxID=363861 RepID=UPI0031D9E708